MNQLKDHDVDTKLKELQKEFERNEALMRKAAIRYEDLVAAKEDLVSCIADLKKARAQRRTHVA